MAIAYDSVSPDAIGSGASLTSGSWTIAGSNRVLIGFNGTVSGPTRDPTGMKWGGSSGTALTIVDSVLSFGSFGRIAGYQLIAPTASSDTLYGTCSGSADVILIGGVSYTGVDQSTPTGTTGTNTGTISSSSGTASITIATAVGDTVVACLVLDDGNFQSPTSAPSGSPLPTERYEANVSNDLMAIQEVVATGTSTTVSFAISAGGTMNATWGIKAMVLTAAPSGPTLSNATSTPSFTSASVGADTTTTTGTAYAVVDSSANLSGVTAAEIKAGQKAGGASALSSGNTSVSASPFSIGSLSGLTSGVLYSYAIVQNDGSFDSNIVTGAFTTLVHTDIAWIRA